MHVWMHSGAFFVSSIIKGKKISAKIYLKEKKYLNLILFYQFIDMAESEIDLVFDTVWTVCPI